RCLSETESAEGIEEQIVPQQSVESVQEEEKDIDLFSLDNIDFKQRQERRRGDRRRGFRRIDDRNLISRAKEEAAAIKEAAAKEGYQEGLQAAKEDLERVKESLEAFFNAKQEIYDNIAPDILEISLDIAKKIIKKETIENPEVILNNIKEIMKGLSKEEAKITLRVNPSQAVMLKNDVPEVADSLGLEAKIIIVADETITEGGCLVTTTNGVIDATIESQLAIISEVLKEI
ncbi:MAG: flagellar assembly protein FliH, partial [Candidatus Gastranaerophilales bacterium]|nr:flagellar assembly protein FliH [Candidatus Gastranaerophilales bacterium]